MSTSCSQVESLLSAQAEGELSAAGAVQLEQHLEECPPCRAESVSTMEALGLIRMPSLTGDERSALVSLPQTTRAALRSADHRASWWRGVAVGMGIAATLVMVFAAQAWVSVNRSAPLPATLTLAPAEPGNGAQGSSDEELAALADDWMNADSVLDQGGDELSVADVDSSDADPDSDLDIGAAD